ncbi:Protein of uncharacterised function (DUF2560) [Serratia proteamaculans]|uniref:DUF2560 family protein n=1 Tax=Serratia proteamaculans TaxID=28151 RepID=UPI002178C7E8|nr:DUF2560 family protein [Serratia proteamaculans]CAI1702230.1 Protein of uncharacterised function (DUF2560) [Serratia proteamaculans]
MSETVEITQGQSIRLRLLMLVGYETTAAAKAIEFVADDPFKANLFEQQFNRTTEFTDVISRTMKAIQESKEALPLFDSTGS